MIGSLSFTHGVRATSRHTPAACARRSRPASGPRASIRCAGSWSLNSFSLEVMLVQRSFQPPPLPTLRVVGGHVVLALARHVEVPPRCRAVTTPARSCTVPRRDAPQQVVPDLPRAGSASCAIPARSAAAVDVGAVPRLLLPRPRRVIRTAPAVLDVARLDQRAIGLLPARRRDVEALARLQVAPSGEHMHVHAAVGIAVPHRRPRCSDPGPARPRRSARPRRAPGRSSWSLGRSSGAQAITPDVYLWSNSSASATAATSSGSPRRTATSARTFALAVQSRAVR